MQGKGEGISLTPHYHFHPPQRHLDINWEVAAELADLKRKPLVSKHESLTTKLRARVLLSSG